MSEQKRTRRAYGQGHIYKRGCRWWIQYRVNGRRVREAAGNSETETEARRKLKARLHEIAAGTYIGPERERVPVNDMLDALEIHLETRGAKAMASLRAHLAGAEALWSPPGSESYGRPGRAIRP